MRRALLPVRAALMTALVAVVVVVATPALVVLVPARWLLRLPGRVVRFAGFDAGDLRLGIKIAVAIITAATILVSTAAALGLALRVFWIAMG